MDRRMICIVFGLPGTGKSYFARHLARDIGTGYLNTDVVRRKLNKEGQYDEGTKEMVYDHLRAEMAGRLAENRKVIVDGTFHKEQRRKQFMGKAAELRAQTFFIEMKANDSTVKDRLQSRDGYSEADYKVYRQIRNSFEPLSEPHLILWSDRQSLDEMLTKAKQYIYEKGSNS